MKVENLVVTAASGVEAVTKRELSRLGYGEPPAVGGAMRLVGSEKDVARLNMFLRTAERVYIEITRFTATTFDELFDGVFAVPWHEIMPKDANICVNGKSVKSRLFAISASQSLVKKAIVKELSEWYGVAVLPESGASYKVEFHILKDEVSILLNTSGSGLHKRGYRDYVGAAPIRETLAAAILLISDFYGLAPLRDPFCGSGTIIIEAALISMRIAAGSQRKFDYNDWKFFDKSAYALAKEEALDLERRDAVLDFVGSDIDPKAVKMAIRHAHNAGLSGKVRFEVKDVVDFTCAKSGGTIVTNPPYGERLVSKNEAERLYSELGRIYSSLDNWSLFLITCDKYFERCFGKFADKNRKLYNADKECRLYEYFKEKDNENRRKTSC